MSTTPASGPRPGITTPGPRDGGPASASALVAFGTSAFAGTMLVLVALFQLLQGIAAVAEDEIFVAGPRYVYQFDVTTWGWIHIIVGVVGLAVGIGLLMGKSWGYTAGIVLAVVGAVINFAFMPYFPVWSIVILAFNVAVIWALTTLRSRGEPAL